MTNLERLLTHTPYLDCAPWFGTIFTKPNGERLKLVAQNDLHVPYFVRMRGKRELKTQVVCVWAEGELRRMQKNAKPVKIVHGGVEHTYAIFSPEPEPGVLENPEILFKPHGLMRAGSSVEAVRRARKRFPLPVRDVRHVRTVLLSRVDEIDAGLADACREVEAEAGGG